MAKNQSLQVLMQIGGLNGSKKYLKKYRHTSLAVMNYQFKMIYSLTVIEQLYLLVYGNMLFGKYTIVTW